MSETLDPSSIADPHCTGFYGEQYDFMGDDGKYYNLISTGTLQINVRMLAVPKSDFTYMDQIGVKIGNQRSGYVRICMGTNLETSGEAMATLDQHHIGKDPVYFDTGLKSKDGDVVMGSVYLSGDTLYIDAGNLSIKSQRSDYDPETDSDTPHLNVFFEVGSLGLLSDGIMPHGVIGQTADKGREKPQGLLGKGIHEGVYRLHEGEGDVFLKHQGGGVIEGVYKDYEVSGPFDDNFTYNRFGTEPTVEPSFGFLSKHLAFL